MGKLTEKQVKNLLKLVDFLEQLEPERFDFSRWVGRDWKGKPDLSCGTTACALGRATTIPSFRKEGLRLIYDSPNQARVMGKFKGQSRNPETRETDFKVAKRLFGLEKHEFKLLFMPAYYYNEQARLPETATNLEVAKLIRQFVYIKTNGQYG